MSTLPRQFRGLLEREQIRECITRLARGEDRRDARLISSSYGPESTADYGVFVSSFAEYLARVLPGSPAIPVTTRSWSEPHRARRQPCPRRNSRHFYHRIIIMGSEERDTAIGGRDPDRLERRGEEWRISSRTMPYDWFQDFGIAADWSNGVMGLPFGASHDTGRAVSDHSKTFFGGK